MKSLLEFFGLCKHSYKTVNIIAVGHPNRSNATISYVYHQQCEKCGKLKRKEIKN